MIPHAFRIGNNVEVIGPSITGNDIHLGKRFKIECMYVNPSQHIQFEPYDGTYYPASSLQLVEELKIGDWVEVVGSPKYFPQYPAKTIFCITKGPRECEGILGFGGIRNCVDCYCGEGTPFYEANSLRKLTPEEIKQHTNPGKQYPITPAKDFDELTLQDVARMAGICKNEYGVWISTLLKRAHEAEDRLSAIEKRLDFVEKFQREQAEATQYRRNMLWMAGP